MKNENINKKWSSVMKLIYTLLSKNEHADEEIEIIISKINIFFDKNHVQKKTSLGNQRDLLCDIASIHHSTDRYFYDYKINKIIKACVVNDKYDKPKSSILRYCNNQLFLRLCRDYGFLNHIDYKTFDYISGMAGSNMGYEARLQYHLTYVYLLRNLSLVKLKEFEILKGYRLKSESKSFNDIYELID